MKLLMKVLLLYLFLSATVYTLLYFKDTKINPGMSPEETATANTSMNTNANVLPFSIAEKPGSHGSYYLGLTVTKDYPFNSYYFRSDNQEFVPERGMLGEVKNSNETSFEVQIPLTNDKLDSKLQVCNPHEVCKTFRIVCEGTTSGYAPNKCTIVDIPEIKNKIPNAYEIKIMHNDLDDTLDYGLVDSNLKVFGDENLYTSSKEITKVESQNRTFEEQTLNYSFERDSFDQNEWDSMKAKLKSLANSISNGAKIIETEKTIVGDLFPTDNETRHIYTITWDSEADFSGLEDYRYEFQNFPSSDSIELTSFNSFRMSGKNYDQRHDIQSYFIDINILR